MASSHITATFGKSAGLSESEARQILGSIAKELWALLPAGGVVLQREWLLNFVRQISQGHEPSVRKIADKLPYDRKVADQYVSLTAQALLDQARIDEQIGLSPAGSVYAEVHWLVPGESNFDKGVSDFARNPTGIQADPGISPDEWGKILPRVAPASPSTSVPDLSGEMRQAWYRRMLNPFRRQSRAPTGASRSRRKSSIAPSPPRAPASPIIPEGLRLPPKPESPRVMNDPEAWRLDPKQQQLQQQQQQGEAPEPLANEYRVWFGTNRKRVDGRFTADRGEHVSYGYCDVYVPRSHKIGSVGSSFLARLVTLTDDRLKLRSVCPLSDDSLWGAIRSQLASVEENERHAVVFVHGFNVSFDEAALRSAQIGVDLGIKGAMAFFSWPSKGTVRDYVADGSAIEASEPAITDFLVNFAERAEATAVHVIAHSMGNRAVLRAVARIAQEAQKRSGVQFANFILAAADVDAQTFRNFASAYSQIARRTTLYVSEKDKAVGLSAFLSDYPRVGFMPPVSVFDGIDTVSVSNLDLVGLGHGYIGEAREVLADMHALIFQGLAPNQRFSLEQKATDEGHAYWAVRV